MFVRRIHPASCTQAADELRGIAVPKTCRGDVRVRPSSDVALRSVSSGEVPQCFKVSDGLCASDAELLHQPQRLWMIDCSPLHLASTAQNGGHALLAWPRIPSENASRCPSNVARSSTCIPCVSARLPCGPARSASTSTP